MNITKDDIGMKVWDIHYGNGRIVSVDNGDRPVTIDYQGISSCVCYCVDGRRFPDDIQPTLYWSKPEIIAPPKPKRKVKKEIVKYALIDDAGLTTFHSSELKAMEYMEDRPGIIVKLTGEYEVEV